MKRVYMIIIVFIFASCERLNIATFNPDTQSLDYLGNICLNLCHKDKQFIEKMDYSLETSFFICE
jgi:hypothetical protein